MRSVHLVIAALGLFGSCRPHTSDRVEVDTALVFVAPPAPAHGAPVLRVYVHRDGTIDANGGSVSASGLDSALAALKIASGEVWLYFEPGLSSRSQAKVAEAVARRNLSNQITERPDFADLKAP